MPHTGFWGLGTRTLPSALPSRRRLATRINGSDLRRRRKSAIAPWSSLIYCSGPHCLDLTSGCASLTGMRHVDMRKLPAAAQEERRRQVVGLRHRGLAYRAIAEQVGLSRTAASAAERHPPWGVELSEIPCLGLRHEGAFRLCPSEGG